MAKLNVLQNEISIISVDGQDYISLTDMANARTDDARAADVIKIGYATATLLSF